MAAVLDRLHSLRINRIGDLCFTEVLGNLFASKITIADSVKRKKYEVANQKGKNKCLLKMDEVKKIWKEADAVMFDVDSTVVREEGIDRLAIFVGKGPEVSKITAEAMERGLDFREALKLRLNIMAPTLKQLEDFIKTYPTTLTPGIVELIDHLRKKNVAVYLVSGGFRRIIEPARILLDIPPENLFANRLLFEDGKYAGFDLNEPTSKNQGKKEVAGFLKEKFGYERLVMIGDGSIDADACPPADAFIGFGGNVIREKVRARAKWYVTSFQELMD